MSDYRFTSPTGAHYAMSKGVTHADLLVVDQLIEAFSGTDPRNPITSWAIATDVPELWNGGADQQNVLSELLRRDVLFLCPCGGHNSDVYNEFQQECPRAEEFGRGREDEEVVGDDGLERPAQAVIWQSGCFI